MPRILEVCIDKIADAEAAVEAGAHRLELCASLNEGGLTPSAGSLLAYSQINCAASVMIRPRAGNFVYTTKEIDIMMDDIKYVKSLGFYGVVFGTLTPDNELDTRAMRRLMSVSGGLSVTLHRAFDFIEDQYQALEQAISLGIDRILTSGGRNTAIEGMNVLEVLVGKAEEGIQIMPGSGITPTNIVELMKIDGINEYHASCKSKVVVENNNSAISLGTGNALSEFQTDSRKVKACIAALNSS